jgi:hypothetical protein
MHRIAAILAVLLAASPAVAQPPYDDYARDRDEVFDRDDRFDREDRPDYRDGWMSLSAYANARDGSTYVKMPRRTQMSTVRVEGTHGAPIVTTVEIFYPRHVQRAQVNRRLVRGQSVDIGVDPRRPIRAIVVHTDARSRGGYTILGS